MATNPNFKAVPIERERELVSIFDTADEAEALIVQGLLESNGVEALLTNLDAPQDVLPGVGGIVLRVRPSDAEEARSIIEQQRNASADLEESSETEVP
jgi:Putative prokaryotic signal transducing protein